MWWCCSPCAGRTRRHRRCNSIRGWRHRCRSLLRRCSCRYCSNRPVPFEWPPMMWPMWSTSTTSMRLNAALSALPAGPRSASSCRTRIGWIVVSPAPSPTELCKWIMQMSNGISLGVSKQHPVISLRSDCAVTGIMRQMICKWGLRVAASGGWRGPCVALRWCWWHCWPDRAVRRYWWGYRPITPVPASAERPTGSWPYPPPNRLHTNERYFHQSVWAVNR